MVRNVPPETESKQGRASAKELFSETKTFIFKEMAHPTGFKVASAFAGGALGEQTMSAFLALAIETRHSADGPKAAIAAAYVLTI
jgi:hypothetical protein